MALDQSGLTIGGLRAAPSLASARPRSAIPGHLLAWLWRYTPIALLALAWELATRLGLVSPLELPALDRVIAAWWGLLASGDLVDNAIVSLSRGAAGLGLAIGCGTVLGVLMAWYKPVRISFNPLVQAVYPMPKSALIPVVVL